jgi:hypothetical protein
MHAYIYIYTRGGWDEILMYYWIAKKEEHVMYVDGDYAMVAVSI